MTHFAGAVCGGLLGAGSGWCRVSHFRIFPVWPVQVSGDTISCMYISSYTFHAWTWQ